MTLRTKSNRQSNVTFPCTGQLAAGRAKMLIPRLRRSAHSPGDFVADAILVPASGDVNMNLGTIAADFDGVASVVNATAATFAEGGAIPTQPTALGVARMRTKTRTIATTMTNSMTTRTKTSMTKTMKSSTTISMTRTAI
jgi:hypothetical protein